MANMELKGMGIALVTPFKADESVDYEALKKLVEFQIQNSTDYLVVLGTTAETAVLTEEEQSEIVRTVVTQVRRRIPVVRGVSGNFTQALVKKMKEIDYEGVDAILSVTPYYNKPSQEGIYQHFKAVAEATDIPIVVYNVPGRTGVNMTAATTLRIAADFEHVIAVKEASGNIVQINEILKNKRDGFQVISGDDGLTFPMIALGAAGVISVIGNALPLEFSRMVNLALAGDYDGARAIHYDLLELFELLFVDGSPAGVKSLLNMMGLIENKLRLPLVPARTQTYEKIREAFQKLEKK